MSMKSAWMSALAATLMLLCSCTGPTHDQDKLRAIKAEARALEASHPIKPPQHWVEIPQREWPPAIARLKPWIVTVHSWGVDIGIKPYFDGGWGYQIPHKADEMPMPAGCYSEPGPGVFWHDPC
jgi:hypothetical protein